MRKISAVICAFLLTPVVMAGVYKYVDENGNTIYTDKKPDVAEDKVEKLNVKNSYTNTMAPPPSLTDSEDGGGNALRQIQTQQKAAMTLEETKRQAKRDAKHAVTDAQKALDDAKVIQAGDMFPTSIGGMRYTEQYLQRIEAAQSSLDAAHKHYNKF